jgi:hypothetical protein
LYQRLGPTTVQQLGAHETDLSVCLRPFTTVECFV